MPALSAQHAIIGAKDTRAPTQRQSLLVSSPLRPILPSPSSSPRSRLRPALSDSLGKPPKGTTTVRAATPCISFGMVDNKPGDAPRGGTPKSCDACIHAQAPPYPEAHYHKRTKYADRMSDSRHLLRTYSGLCSRHRWQGSRPAERGAAAARRQHPRST
ncbi:hypothetical protein CCMA1212_001843 [Trichoderma ghanense]|uniref:SSCRP protein n=1 Tax=Trichoderma ghanense TaxID=65468 RepID=A0ABY2HDT0_9HYPO